MQTAGLMAMGGTVGMELRRARERARLSLDDLSARTKIRVSLLGAMEREQFERLPAGLLTRGFLRAYSREVGLDPEAIVRQYISEFERDTSTSGTLLEPAPEWEPVPAGSGRWHFLIQAIPLALAAVFFIRLLDRTDAAVPVTQPALAPAVGTSGLDAGGVELARDESPRARNAPLVADPLLLEIHPTADVWLDVVADGQQVLYELLPAGERRSIEIGEEASLLIGDAAAFTYSINGVPGRALGAPRQVREIRITPDNYIEFQDGY